MDRRLKQKLLTVKVTVLEEQRDHLQTVVSATDKVLTLANDWIRDADEESDDTFEELSCLVENMILFLGDNYADLPDKFSGFETFNTKEMQKAISSLTLSPKKLQQDQPDGEEHLEDAQGLDNCYGTEHQSMIQTELKAQTDIEKNTHLIHRIMEDQKESNDKHENELETLNVRLDDILDSIHVLGTRIGHVETKAVDHTQLKDLQMSCEILEVNSENVQCKLEELDAVFQDLANKLEEASRNQRPIPEFQNLQTAEEKINAFEEEWKKAKEEVGKLYNDFEAKNQVLCQIIAGKLAPLQKLREIFNKQLNARKDNIKKLDTVYSQMADLLPKFRQHESNCDKQFVGCIVHKSLTSRPVANSVVYFPEIISDFGNYFDIRSGTFTCPADGLYATSLNINGDKDVTVSLVKQPNGSVFTRSLLPEEIILGKVATSTNSFTSSAFIVVDLKSDDKLCVKYGAVETDSNSLGDSTFACFRIGSLQ